MLTVARQEVGAIRNGFALRNIAPPEGNDLHVLGKNANLLFGVDEGN